VVEECQGDGALGGRGGLLDIPVCRVWVRSAGVEQMSRIRNDFNGVNGVGRAQSYSFGATLCFVGITRMSTQYSYIS